MNLLQYFYEILKWSSDVMEKNKRWEREINILIKNALLMIFLFQSFEDRQSNREKKDWLKLSVLSECVSGYLNKLCVWVCM